MSAIPMTKLGRELIEKELNELKTVERPRIIEEIAAARALGDLKENAEYHSAREQQSFIEGRIRELETKLSHAQVIEIDKIANHGKVIFGSTVTIESVNDGKKMTYQIVGEDEANIAELKVSVTSPVARALIGKVVDDSVEVITPNGEVLYDIVKVEYI